MSEEEKLQLENECLLNYSKAQMIQKYIDELEENCTLSDLWCKSQEENKRLHNIIKEVREYITSQKLHKIQDTTGGLTYQERKLLEILGKGENNVEI